MPKRGGARTPDVVHGTGNTTTAAPVGLVARLVPLRAAACVAPCGAGPATGTTWAARTAAVPAADTSHGRWTNESALDGSRPAGDPAAVGINRDGLRLWQSQKAGPPGAGVRALRGTCDVRVPDRSNNRRKSGWKGRSQLSTIADRSTQFAA